MRNPQHLIPSPLPAPSTVTRFFERDLPQSDDPNDSDGLESDDVVAGPSMLGKLRARLKEKKATAPRAMLKRLKMKQMGPKREALGRICWSFRDAAASGEGWEGKVIGLKERLSSPENLARPWSRAPSARPKDLDLGRRKKKSMAWSFRFANLLV